MSSSKNLPLLLLLSTCPPSSSFASFLVDRRTSCFTHLEVDEVIMNHPALHHSASIHDIRLRLEPMDDIGTYSVDFDSPSSLKDLQYVLELSEDSPAKFTSAPRHGGMGCNDSRVYGKPGDGAAIVRIDEGAAKESRIEIRGGWATGHEAVTLVEPVIMTIGEEEEDEEEDDAYQDDQAEAEHEEHIIEEERAEIEEEITDVEKDVIEALEEKRSETAHDSADINEAEEEIIQTLEDKRKEMDKALNSLKDEIIIDKANKSQMHDAKMTEMHRTDAQSREMRRAHAEEMERKHRSVDQQLNHMDRRIQDSRMRAKLEHFKKMRENFKDNEEVLRAIDKAEHQRVKEDHGTIPSLDKKDVDVDMERIKETVHKHQMERHHEKVDKMMHDTEANRREAREKFHEMHETMERDGIHVQQRSGVHEMMNGRDVKVAVDRIKGHLKKGLPRGGEAFHGEVGRPLSGRARNGLLGMFGVVLLVGVVRWGLDKRRWRRKGHVA